ncbi:hypothetical protein LCGC14_0441460 [marine sediment metagenome]|uniref:Uncharacterized protein n=1 Tax=marine sediment metagenome TaxID=412755 RepID=A0A0F9SRA1_9ZZZZ
MDEMDEINEIDVAEQHVDDGECPCPLCRLAVKIRARYWEARDKLRKIFTHQCVWKSGGKIPWKTCSDSDVMMELETFWCAKCGKIYIPVLDDIPFHPNHKGCIVPVLPSASDIT